MNIYPECLKAGDTISIIAPSGSMDVVDKDILRNIDNYFGKFGIHVTYGKFSQENHFGSGGSIENRVFDLMQAFKNPDIKAIIPIFGGYTANQLLPFLDYEVIKNNPKIFMGYSDITALNVAIFTKTGLITFLGPGGTQLGHFFSDNYTIEKFEALAFGNNKAITNIPSNEWKEGVWWLNKNQDTRTTINNEGWITVNNGIAIGTAFGGNLSTLSLLAGTEFFRIPQDPILFLEECGEFNEGIIIRFLEHMNQIGLFKEVKGVAFGRFEHASKINKEYIVENLKRYIGKDVPLLLDVDFGHTEPMMTIPIGSKAKIDTNKSLIEFDLTTN